MGFLGKPFVSEKPWLLFIPDFERRYSSEVLIREDDTSSIKLEVVELLRNLSSFPPSPFLNAHFTSELLVQPLSKTTKRESRGSTFKNESKDIWW